MHIFRICEHGDENLASVIFGNVLQAWMIFLDFAEERSLMELIISLFYREINGFCLTKQ
jgi:hypothetical protein